MPEVSSGRSIVAKHWLPKPARWVRFPSPAPTFLCSAISTGGWIWVGCARWVAPGTVRLGLSCTHPKGRFWGHRVSVRVSGVLGGWGAASRWAVDAGVNQNHGEPLSLDGDGLN